MTTALRYLLLFVFLALHFSFNTAFEKHDNNDAVLATVHVTNSLPRDSEPINLRCSSVDDDLGFRDLGVGNDYSWSVEKEVLYRCEAMWEKKFASWHAFQPKRDANHGTVFWLVKEDGFFLSWDNSSWVKKYTWETE